MRNELKLAVARKAALDPKRPGGMPYFSSALQSFPVHFSRSVPTMAMSAQGVLYVNDDFLTSVKNPVEVGTVLLHETMHFISQHSTRFLSLKCPDTAAYRKFWNIMADFEINSTLRTAGCTFPTDLGRAAFPDDWSAPIGKTAEYYYTLLLPRMVEINAAYQGAMGGECGTVAGGSAPWEDADVESALGKTPRAIAAKQREIASAVREYADSKKGAGGLGVPGNLLRWAGAILQPPRVKWEHLLQTALHRDIAAVAGTADWTYARAHKKFPRGHGLPVRAGLAGPSARVRVYIDTSISMETAELSIAISEAHGILSQLGCPIEFASCDTDCEKPRLCASIEEIKRRLVGGGGTLFEPIIDQLTKEGLGAPKTAVIMTDGGGRVQVKPPPHTKIIWVLVGDHTMTPYTDEGPVTWGTIIKVPKRTDDADV